MNVRYSILLALLTGVLLLLPPLSQHASAMAVLASIYGAILVSSVLAIGDGRAVRLAAVALAVPALGMDLRDLSQGVDHPTLPSMAFDAAFLAFVLSVLSNHIRAQTKVTRDLILGGTCVYLLMGIFFAHLYAMMETASPGAFLEVGRTLDHATGAADVQNFVKLTYFSFVSLTTLGYGDIQPVLPIARAVASLEAVVGQVYVAVFIGTLVGQRVARKTGETGAAA